MKTLLAKLFKRSDPVVIAPYKPRTKSSPGLIASILIGDAPDDHRPEFDAGPEVRVSTGKLAAPPLGYEVAKDPVAQAIVEISAKHPRDPKTGRFLKGSA